MDKKPNSPGRNLEAIKTLAIAVGAREAARRLNLNANTVLSWAKRHNWALRPAQDARPAPAPARGTQPAIKTQSSPSEALKTVLSDLGDKTKANLAKASYKATNALAEMPGKALATPAGAKTAQGWASAAQTVHGWDKDSSGSGVVSPLTVYSHQTVIAVHQTDSPAHSTGEE